MGAVQLGRRGACLKVAPRSRMPCQRATAKDAALCCHAYSHATGRHLRIWIIETNSQQVPLVGIWMVETNAQQVRAGSSNFPNCSVWGFGRLERDDPRAECGRGKLQ